MTSPPNPELRIAHDFVHYTDRNIFLTGKAGTGKTTFLHRLKQDSPKRMAVVAPTGVAAINAGGVTIHSLFQLPFGPILPDGIRREMDASVKKFHREKIALLKSLDLLVIDEISMVRADVLDGIDHVLRRFRNHALPFGGLQLLMIGDLHQLPPIVKDEEWALLRDYYETPYFFSSIALKGTDPVAVELTHIYRQTDGAFIHMLNGVRENNISAEALEALNRRYIPGFLPGEEEPYITLTTHNATAQAINRQKLESLSVKSSVFEAVIQDDFPPHAYPADVSLELKPGAQVMFVKNDTSREKLYYNGKIGKVLRMEDGLIYVQCPGDEDEIEVSPVVWSNIKYSLDPATKEVKEDKIGSFTQYPLRLAWAITIHKSQGLTFERAIIDASASFAHGQVYVALSRCKTLEGVVLRSRIGPGSIRTDGLVSRYSSDIREHIPDEGALAAAKKNFRESLIRELFDLMPLDNKLAYCGKLVADHLNTLPEGTWPRLQELMAGAKAEIFRTANTFREQLDRYFAADTGADDAALGERIKKGSAYYEAKIGDLGAALLRDIQVETDNKAVRAALTESLEAVEKECFIRKAVFSAARQGFDTTRYLQAKANADIDFKSARRGGTAFNTAAPGSPSHAALNNALKAWRDKLAAEKGSPVYMILPQRTISAIVQYLPVTWKELETIKGMGRAKMGQYGGAILEIIQDYVFIHGINVPQGRIIPPEPAPEVKEKKTYSKKLSLELWRGGKTVSEIAAVRSLAATTIESHLAHYVGTGELDIRQFVPAEKITAISRYFEEQKPASLTEAKAALGETFTFGELRMVQQYLARQQAV